jgi:peroxiredoxin Q/BCP
MTTMPLIEPGSAAPALRLPDAKGTVHTLASLKGKTVVLYFYPKDDTSGCTDEACQFRDLLPKFTTAKAVVLGVSPDGSTSHAKFASKHGLNFTLLADEPGPKGVPATCSAYGTWQEKSMYGRKYFGVVRTTYLIGPDGKVLRRWDKVSVPGHAAEVLAAIAGGKAAPAKSTAAGAAKVVKAAKAAKAAKSAVRAKVAKTARKPAAKPAAKATRRSRG